MQATFSTGLGFVSFVGLVSLARLVSLVRDELESIAILVDPQLSAARQHAIGTWLKMLLWPRPEHGHSTQIWPDFDPKRFKQNMSSPLYTISSCSVSSIATAGFSSMSHTHIHPLPHPCSRRTRLRSPSPDDRATGWPWRLCSISGLKLKVIAKGIGSLNSGNPSTENPQSPKYPNAHLARDPPLFLTKWPCFVCEYRSILGELKPYPTVENFSYSYIARATRDQPFKTTQTEP